jgi:hypothetical protein
MVLIINYIITFLVISLYVVNMTHIYNTLSNSYVEIHLNPRPVCG